mgnify:CR=1 FL=1
MTAREWAQRYLDHGWKIVPLAPRTKRATAPGWQEIDFTAADVRPDDNLGLRSIEGLAFVDLDCPEGVQMADVFLPATPTIYGRHSKPRSKRIYRSAFEKTAAYKDKDTGTVLVEIRSQHQDMAPPSIHPDGEPLTWDTPDLGTPATVPAEDLTRAVKLLCTAAAIGRHYNAEGSRHDWCLALAGLLRKRGITEVDCTAVITAAARWAQDDKLTDRLTEVQSTYAHEDDAALTGARTLDELDHGSLTRTLSALWGVPASATAYILNQRNQPDRNVLPNIHIALDRLDVSLRFDLFAKKPFMQYNGYRGLMDEDICTDLWLDCDEREHFRPNKELFFDALKRRARQDCYHPVREYLGRLVWDGTPRLESWLIESARADDTPYTRAVSAIVLTAAVRRVLHPGCKFDEMMVLESGTQGMLKSSALQALCPESEWFSDDLPLNVSSKEIVERTAGKWIIEASDLSGMRASQVEHLKGMLSRQVDGPVRLAYARLPIEAPRQFILIGTTNSYTYLSDHTGNRRFWPVRVDAFDIAWITSHRDQLWAEAVSREAAGASIRLNPDLYAAAGEQQASRTTDHPWADTLRAAYADREPGARITPEDIWVELTVPVERRNSAGARTVAGIMQALDYRRITVRDGSVIVKGWGRD